VSVASSTPATPSRLRPLGLALGLAAGALLLAAGVTARLRTPLPAVYATLPDFALVDQNGRAFGSSALRGRIWIADFIFTHCGGICPAMTSRLARLRRELPDQVAFVSFTVDPTRDTPEVLARYARDFGAADSWSFVTGPQQALYALATGGFKLEAFEVPPDQQAGGDGPFLHSGKFVLVDAESRIRGYYDSSDEAAVRRLAADAHRVLEAAR
jgi:cytochrome oxidase Cu insertion factor (SCO1/SenC/PrrC family)